MFVKFRKETALITFHSFMPDSLFISLTSIPTPCDEHFVPGMKPDLYVFARLTNGKPIMLPSDFFTANDYQDAPHVY